MWYLRVVLGLPQVAGWILACGGLDSFGVSGQLWPEDCTSDTLPSEKITVVW